MEIDYVRVYQESELGVSEAIQNPELRLYPNPVLDVLNIQIKHLENQKVFLSIFDISGRLISETKPMVRNQQISLSTQPLNSGVFVAQIKLENGYQTFIKFIKL